MTMKASSTFAETIVTQEETAAIMPAALSYEDAATLPIAGSTAWTALIDTAHLQSGQRVLINGCLGNVGRAAVQIARIHGAKIVGTCSATGIEEARDLGCGEACDYRRFDPSRHKKAFDIVFDTSGAFGPRTCLKMLASDGLGLHININPIKMIQVLLTRRNKAVIAKTPPVLLARLGELAIQGSLRIPIVERVPLDAAIAAITKLERTGRPKARSSSFRMHPPEFRPVARLDRPQHPVRCKRSSGAKLRDYTSAGTWSKADLTHRCSPPGQAGD